ncbi:MAG TPA: class C sortase, partial [Ilumatobacteraceae bacterium]|nr:class C sortase [Ilumatobacteraceae bacterium]
TIPRIKVKLPVYHGTSDDTLAKGVGHLYGTSLPVGGIGTHAVLTSHTALTTATLFDHLDEMKVDDVFFIDVYGETLAYQVDQIKIILPQEISDLTIVDGEDYVTLVTCTPYAVNTHRLLVRGHRIPVEVAETTPSVVAASPSVIQPWMYWLLAGAAAGVVALLVIALLAWRRRRRQRRLAPMATIEPTRASTTAPQ